MTSGSGQFSMQFSHYAPCLKNVCDGQRHRQGQSPRRSAARYDVKATISRHASSTPPKPSMASRPSGSALKLRRRDVRSLPQKPSASGKLFDREMRYRVNRVPAL